MSKKRNYHKKPVVTKDRFVGVRLDKESFSKVEEAAMAAGLSISEYIRRALTRRKITIKEEIVVEVPVIKELIVALGKTGANLNQIAHHFNAGGVLSQQMYRETMKAYADLYAMKVGIEKLGGAFRSYPEAYSRKNSDYGDARTQRRQAKFLRRGHHHFQDQRYECQFLYTLKDNILIK